MKGSDRNSAIAAAVILAAFGLLAYLMPGIMVAVGDYSPVVAAALAVLFVLAFFLVFYLRGRAQRRSRGE